MAITFSKNISIVDFNNTYNNNVVEFQSSLLLSQPKKCIITIGALTFEITPIGLLFRYNFKESIKAIINTNNFQDDILPTDDILEDNSLKLAQGVTFQIVFVDLTTDNVFQTYNFLKSVKQIGDTTIVSTASQSIINQTSLTLFNGYPFDVAYFSVGDVTILNTDNNRTKTLTAPSQSVYRIFLSNGVKIIDEADNEEVFNDRILALSGGVIYDNPCMVFELVPILEVGVNNVDFNSTTNTITTKIILRDNCLGVYLKWFNEDGSWSYWLFDKVHQQDTSAETKDVFNVDFDNLEDTFSTKLITGKEASNLLRLNYKNLTNDESLQVESVLTSPRVELYNGVNGDPVTSSSWQSVRVVDGTFNIFNTKRAINNINITIIKNKYTQV